MSGRASLTGRAARAGSFERSFIPVRGPATGKFYFMFDPERDLVEICRGGIKETIDLGQYRQRVLTEKPKL